MVVASEGEMSPVVILNLVLCCDGWGLWYLCDSGLELTIGWRNTSSLGRLDSVWSGTGVACKAGKEDLKQSVVELADTKSDDSASWSTGAFLRRAA